MFAISYSVPQQPGVDLRSAYFDGQKTGWDQMAEVAADRNQKRQIEIDRQRLALQYRTEERLRREGIEQRKIQREQNRLAGQIDPIVQAQAQANLAKTMAETEQLRSSIQNDISAANISVNNRTAIMADQREVARAEELAIKREQAAKTPTPQEMTKATTRGTTESVTTETRKPVYTVVKDAMTEYLRKTSMKPKKTQAQIAEESQQNVARLFSANQPVRASSGTGFGKQSPSGSSFTGEDFLTYA